MAHFGRPWLALRCCSRGTASVEIVVMLPVFLVLLLGTYYVHDVALARQRALSDARGCAYGYAVRGCPSDAAKVPGCKGLTAGLAGEVDGHHSDTEAQAQALKDDVGRFPVLSSAVDALFGKGGRARAKRSHRDLLGSEPGATEQSFYMTCNTVPSSFADHLWALLRDVGGLSD
jgi:hypothetical protein